MEYLAGRLAAGLSTDKPGTTRPIATQNALIQTVGGTSQRICSIAYSTARGGLLAPRCSSRCAALTQRSPCVCRCQYGFVGTENFCFAHLRGNQSTPGRCAPGLSYPDK